MNFSSSKCLVISVLVWLVTFVVPASADMVSIPIAVGTDDVKQEFGGTHRPGQVNIGANDLELGMENVPPERDPAVPMRVGLRFLDVNIPAGASINSAHIQFKVKQGPKSEFATDGDASLTIYGWDLADAPTFPTADWSLTDITDLTLPVIWEDIPLWEDGDLGLAGPDQLTSNLAAIVEHIISLDGWTAGNAMAFLIDPTVVGVDGNGDDILSLGTRTATSFEYPAQHVDDPPIPDPAPVLTIDFTLGIDPSADFDLDDDVDGKDFLRWQGGFGTMGGASKGQGDANDDGNVDADDLAFWQTQYGNPPPLSAVHNVPEPATPILLALAALGLLGLRGRWATMKIRWISKSVTLILVCCLVAPIGAPAEAVSVNIPLGLTLEPDGDNYTDDAEEQTIASDSANKIPGWVGTGSSDIELGQEEAGGAVNGCIEGTPCAVANPMIGGFRFLDIPIPKGAMVTSATIQFTAKQDDKNAFDANFKITGELVPNATTFVGSPDATATFGISGRDRTLGTIVWTPDPWTGGDAGPAQLTPNLSTLVQEIVDQAGWQLGNAMAFIINGSRFDGFEGNRTALSADVDVNQRAVLNLEYVGLPDPSADFDTDDDVDGKDFLSWQGGFGTMGGASKGQGDANDDGNVDADDLAIWQTQYGNPPPLSAVSGVPEPATATLFILAALGMLGLRGRRAIS